MTQTEFVIDSLTQERTVPARSGEMTYPELIERFGCVLQKMKSDGVLHKGLLDLPITKVTVSFQPFEGAKKIIWTYQCVGSGPGSRIVRYQGNDTDNYGFIVASGYFTIGHMQCDA